MTIASVLMRQSTSSYETFRRLLRVAQNVAATSLEPYVRVAIGVESTPTWVTNLVNRFFTIRALAMRHLFLPHFRDLAP